MNKNIRNPCAISYNDIFYKIILSLASSSWIITICVLRFTGVLYSLLYVSFIVGISYLSLWCLDQFEHCDGPEIMEIYSADHLPVYAYLLFCFIGLMLPNIRACVFIYIISSAIAYVTNVKYYNIIFLIFGYHYYNAMSDDENNIIIIKHGNIVKDKLSIYNTNYYKTNRISTDNTAFIESR